MFSSPDRRRICVEISGIRHCARRCCIKINECNLKTGRHTPVLGPRSESRSYLGYSSCLIGKQFCRFSSPPWPVNNIIHENKGEFRFRIVTMFGSKERMKWVVFFFTFNFIWEKHGIGKRNDFVVGTIPLSILSLALQCFVAVEVGQPDTKKRRRGTWQHIVSHEDRTRNSPSLSIQFW